MGTAKIRVTWPYKKGYWFYGRVSQYGLADRPAACDKNNVKRFPGKILALPYCSETDSAAACSIYPAVHIRLLSTVRLHQSKEIKTRSTHPAFMSNKLNSLGIIWRINQRRAVCKNQTDDVQ